MARYADLDPHATTITQVPTLSPVNWNSIGQQAPQPLPISARHSDDRLPVADIVILTWTNAEWSALDYIFLHSDKPRANGDATWKEGWFPYTRGSASYTPDAKSGALWGWFQFVKIIDRSARPWRVLLFKSNSHLAHSPWIPGLSAMVRQILDETGADRIYSIGTAGGSRLNEKLGASVVTNCAQFDMQRPQNYKDNDNGALYRCKTWYPSTALFADIEQSLLFKMNQVVTPDALENIFEELKKKHPDDPDMDDLKLSDLVNDPLRPDLLDRPRILPLINTPLLTTDFYFIAGESNAAPYSFLEMDDAVIAREADRMNVRYVFVRNVSDPIVSLVTQSGKKIAEDIRSDWSGIIYNHYGLLTSFNGALAAWATIAGEGISGYVPQRSANIEADSDPLEVKLAYQVRSCGSCEFFWPQDKTQQVYGPYTAYDFDINAPYAALPAQDALASSWLLGRTRPPAFPEAEILDGCWKAPIMTIGINPNMTAFSPGRTGASWCYPNFYTTNGSNEWNKYAWYYRHRTVYQERLNFDFVRRFILPEGRVFAPAPGQIISALRTDDNPAWTFHVRYDGDAADTEINLPGKQGDFPYMLLFDAYPPNNVFKAGDVLAGKLSVPGGLRVEIQQQQQGYYMQFVPVLQHFEKTLQAQGIEQAKVQIGEDVCQLDMVACASPHWNPGFLGGTPESVQTIVENCVTRNAWAIKQFLQVRPAALYIVSARSWEMFRQAFGSFVRRDPPLSTDPADGDFTLLRETTDAEHPCEFAVKLEVDGQIYESVTRLIITPHFSYNENFLPQFRLSPEAWSSFSEAQPECVTAMTPERGFTLVKDPQHPDNYVALQLPGDEAKRAEALAWLQQSYPMAYSILEPNFYDPHTQMASVLDDLWAKKVLSWHVDPEGHGYLSRTPGPCHFCSNRHWQLPFGCSYGSDKEKPLPAEFLEKVAAKLVEMGPPAPEAS